MYNLLTSMNVPPIHHKTLKRREREGGKGIETVANRLMAKALLEESTKTRGRLVLVRREPLRNFNGPFCYPKDFVVQNECMFLKFYKNV